jgi:hypothetical protein
MRLVAEGAICCALVRPNIAAAQFNAAVIGDGRECSKKFCMGFHHLEREYIDIRECKQQLFEGLICHMRLCFQSKVS